MAWYEAPACASRARAGRIRVLLAGVAALALGACDFPTEPPIFESRFLVPAERTTIDLDELLPSEVSVVGENFSLAIRDTTLAYSLATLCGAECALVPAGTPLPKPPFTADLDFAVRFPADVQSAVLASGSIRLELSQDFGFDAIASGGFIRTVITNGGRVVARDSVGGSFASGTTLVRDVALAAGALTGDLVGTVTVHSPAQPTTVISYDPDASLTLRIRPGVPAPVLVSEAVIRRPSAPVRVNDVQLDLSDIDESLADRVQSGTIVATTTNPFNTGGALTLTVRLGGQVIAARQVGVFRCGEPQPCVRHSRVEPPFSQAEMRAMLGQVVTVSVEGVLTGGDEFITVRPGQAIGFETMLDLTLRLGADDE